MVYSILTEAKVKGSVADQKPTERAYSTYWVENKDTQGWDSFFGLDVIGAWNGFLFATKRNSSGDYIGPVTNFTPIDSEVNDKIFFRLKYDKSPKNTNSTNKGKIQWITLNDTSFDDVKSIEFDLVSNGKWVFYEIDMGQVSNWVGSVTNIRFFPCENGALNDDMFLNFFEIGTTNFTFSFSNNKAGLAGNVKGSLSLTEPITITKGVNDKLIVNIDSYGDVQITLTPQRAASEIIARDISLQLGKVAIGGYIRAEAFIEDQENKLVIESGIRSLDSSVTIVVGDQTTAYDLGFFSQSGFFLGTTTGGTDPAGDYVPLSAYRPTTLEIISLFDNDSVLPSFTLNPQQYSVEGGRRDFGLIGRKLKSEIIVEGRDTGFIESTITTDSQFDARAKTLIDLTHPFTDDGLLDKIFVNGLLDTNGGSKWKIFRPKLNGQLTLVADGEIGKTNITEVPTGGLVLTVETGVFVADVSSFNIVVRRGDLLGIFNAQLHVGSVGTDKIDAIYYSVNGDVIGTITPEVPLGAGEAGLPIYARGSITKHRAVIDIDLKRRSNIDKIKVRGEEETRDVEYNIATANSVSFNIDLTGEHEICWSQQITPTEIRVCDQRVNTAFNVSALNDGTTLAENGISAFGDQQTNLNALDLDGTLGGATVAGATYFYVNGDAEFLNTHEFAGREGTRFDFFRDPLGIDCIFSQSNPRTEKSIGKVVLFFKDRKNQRSWRLEHASSNTGAGASKANFTLIDPDTINLVKIDEKVIVKLQTFITQKIDSPLSDILLRNPVALDVVTDDGVINPQAGVNFTDNVGELGGVNFREQVTFIDFQWNRFEWNFDNIRTDTLRWFSDFHWSTKISEFQVFATSQTEEALGDNIQVLFSSDGEIFTSAALLSADEDEASFKVGNSPQFLRLIIRPTLDLSIHEIIVEYEDDKVCLGEEGRLSGNLTIEDARRGTTGEATPLLITNGTDQTADLLLDISPDIQSSKQLLYFNQLNNAEEITRPAVGPPGRVDFTADKILRESKNVAFNAEAFGLNNLTPNPGQLLTSELLVNNGFETGDLGGAWGLFVSQSGSLSFQIPAVIDLIDNPSFSFPTGVYSFGYSIDPLVIGQGSAFTTINFQLDQEVDISEFSSSIDTGNARVLASLRYLYYGVGDSPLLIILGAPTLSGVELASGTIIDGYGTNLLTSFTLPKSGISDETSNKSNIVASTDFELKVGTRFLQFRYNSLTTGSVFDKQKVLLDDMSLKLRLPTVSTVKWYKSFKTGMGDFYDAQFDEQTVFTKTAGSTHWYQPWDILNTTGIPGAGQTQGFSDAFEADRFKGVQSFRRMKTIDPGVLSCQWEGEKTLVGFRIGFAHNTSTNKLLCRNYPRKWQVGVLRTEEDLGQVPDIEKAHFTNVRTFNGTGRWEGPQKNDVGGLVMRGQADGGGPFQSRILTYLLNTPIETEGMRIEFLVNCDKFERASFLPLGESGFAAFNSATGCPTNDGFFVPGVDFTSTYGLCVTYFVPLISGTNNNDLILDNTQETNNSNFPLPPVYAAVDLGRIHDINTSTDFFELLAETIDQTQWNATTAAYSAQSTSDVNQIVWTGGANKARWIRFSSGQGSEGFESTIESVLTSSPVSHIVSFPQSTIYQSRVYPDISTTSFFLIGPNSSWTSLGDILTDNRNDTFVYYSDYPIIAFNLGRDYVINDDTSLPRNNHDFLAGVGFSPDKTYWQANTEDNIAYVTNINTNITDPENVPFIFNAAPVPTKAIRWFAIKGASDLLNNSETTNPKSFNIRTQGQTLFNITMVPKTGGAFTENANWFGTKKVSLRDLSTFKFTTGVPFSVTDSVDFGSGTGANVVTSSGNNLGNAFAVFDGRFDDTPDDIWGVILRDSITFIEDPDKDFPHFIWRVFRDPYRGEIQNKTVTSIRILGFNDQFHPKDFKFQKLISTTSDPNLNASWQDISGSSFTSIDSYQGGLGFTQVLVTPVTTAGIRLYITNSKYPDDSVQDLGIGGNINDYISSGSTQAQDTGPQTRLASMEIFEEVIESATIVGELDTNHSLFGTFTSVNDTLLDQGVELLGDGILSTFWRSPIFEDTVTVTFPSPITVNRVEWEQDSQLGFQSGGLSTNAPSSFTVTALIAGKNIPMVSQEDYIGTLFSGTLGIALTSDTFTFDITSVQGQNEGASSIQLSEFRLIEVQNQTTPLVVITEDNATHPASPNTKSTKLTYAQNSSAAVRVILDGIDGGSDPDWSTRDFFSLWVHVNNINFLDTTFGNIKLGNDSEVYYRWDISDLTLNSGWNQLKLQFRTASDRSEIPFQPGVQYDSNTGDSQVDFATAAVQITTDVDGAFSVRTQESPGIRFFEIEFRGSNSTTQLELILDDFRFLRNRFDDVCKFEPSLYLNNSDLFTINLEGLDLATGTVEFWFSPDWDTAARMQGNNTIIPAIFRIIRPDGKFLSLFYRPNQGFVCMIFDGLKLYQFISSVQAYRFDRFDVFHFALVWDANRGILPQKASLAMYVNGEPIYGTETTWRSLREGGNSVIFGGEVGQRFAASPHNATALTFTPVPTLPTTNTASCWALLENIKIYNYPKTDFSDINDKDITRTQELTPSEMIELSVDNVNFFGVGSSSLPLRVPKIAPADTVTVYIRTIIPKELSGRESRDASLIVRWKTPLQECT